MNTRKLQRRPTLVIEKSIKKRTSGPLKKIHPLLANSQTPKSTIRPKRLRKDDKEQIEARTEYVISTEKAPYVIEEEIPDEYIDAQFNLEDAIIQTKKNDFKKRKVNVEWSGQDIIAALEPYKTNNILSSLNRIRFYRKGWISPLYKMRQTLQSFVNSGYFENFMTLCVTLNTITLAIDYYGIDPGLEKNLNNLNLAFTLIF